MFYGFGGVFRSDIFGMVVEIVSKRTTIGKFDGGSFV